MGHYRALDTRQGWVPAPRQLRSRRPQPTNAGAAPSMVNRSRRAMPIGLGVVLVACALTPLQGQAPAPARPVAAPGAGRRPPRSDTHGQGRRAPRPHWLVGVRRHGRLALPHGDAAQGRLGQRAAEPRGPPRGRHVAARPGRPVRSASAPAPACAPGRLHVTWENDNTLRVETDAGLQTRRLFFTPSPAAGRRIGPTWQGIVRGHLGSAGRRHRRPAHRRVRQPESRHGRRGAPRGVDAAESRSRRTCGPGGCAPTACPTAPAPW